MKKKNNDGVMSPNRREMIKLGTLTGAAALVAFGGVREVIARDSVSSGEAATPRRPEPIIIDGGPRSIQVSFPFPVEVESHGSRQYVVSPDGARPHIQRIVVTDESGVEVLDYPVDGSYRITFF